MSTGDPKLAQPNMAEARELTVEEKELIESLHRSFQQAERGEYRPVQEFLEELRKEDKAADNENCSNE